MSFAESVQYPQQPLRRFVQEIVDGPFGSSLTSSHYSDTGARVIRLGNIGAAHFRNSDVAYIPTDYFRQLQRHEVKPGDLLIAGLGDERHPVGRACIAPEDLGPAIVKADCFRARLDEQRVMHRFAAWALSSSFVADQVATLSRGSTRTRINLDVAREIHIPVPSLEEQRRIADFLDAETARMAGLNSARQRQVDLLRARLDSKWNQAIFRDGRQHGWVPLRRFIREITDGPFGSSLTSSHYTNDGARVIRLGNIGRAAFRDRDPAYIDLGYFRGLRRHEAQPGDLIIAGLGDENNPLGRACVVPEDLGPAMVKADCFRLRLDQQRILHTYASWALSSPVVAEQVVILGRGSTRTRINLSVVREVAIPTPPPESQRQTVAALEAERRDISTALHACEQQLALVAERHIALITAAVTGQIDVSTASERGAEG